MMTRSARVEDVRRIGVLRANGIGDFLMVVPALESVRRTYPDAEITVIGDTWLPPFLAGRPGPWDRAVVAPCYPGLRGRSVDAPPGPDLEAFVDEHRGRYDVLLQMHGGGRTSNTLVRMLRPRLSAGAGTADADALDRSLPYLAYRNEVLRWLEVAGLVGGHAPAELDELRPRLTVTEADLCGARQAWPHDGPALVIHAGARDRRRCWAAQSFAALARRLVAHSGLPVVLVGGPDDRDDSREVAAALRDCAVTDLTGRLTLAATLGVVSRARLFVGNDSGPRHLAVAARTPTLGVFWVGNAFTFGPVVGAEDRSAISFRSTCPVCGQDQLDRRCGHDVSFVDDVTVDAAYELAVALLDSTGR